ncbi:uncharacterized protein LOC62_01G001070 [Vanrija pseudolonga]|uniref:Uncharacterized protein n=1 Tax=Vanrija pseudolonga TaxID=143232 RepID=A0AAF0Y4G5_9TREE|nr:hypothetical protein LOC62_01G001070 [Vanrija pseudolonga]
MEKHAPHHTTRTSTFARALAVLLLLAAAGSAQPVAQINPATPPGRDDDTAASASASASASPSPSPKSTSKTAMWAMLGVLIVAAVIFVTASIAYCLGFKKKRNQNRRDAAVGATRGAARPRVRRRERDPADMSVIDLPLYTNEPAHDEVQLLRRHNTLSEAGHAAPEYLSPTAGVPPYASQLGHGDDEEGLVSEDGHGNQSATSPSTSSHASHASRASRGTVRPVLRALSTSESALSHASRGPGGPASAGPSRSAAAPYSPILARRASLSASQASHGNGNVSRHASVRSVRFEAAEPVTAPPSRQPSKASIKQRLGAWAESYVALGDQDDDDERIGEGRGVRDPWSPLSIRHAASATSPSSPNSASSHTTFITAPSSLSRRSTADSITEARVATVSRGRVARAVIAAGEREVVFEAHEEEMLAESHDEGHEELSQQRPQSEQQHA